MSSSHSSENRGSPQSHSTYDEDLYLVVHSGQGVAIQCQFCPGQGFRRSKLRPEDITQLLLMRYPVRCLRCSQRQRVSFTVAGISVPSHVRQRRARQMVQQKHWKEPETRASEPLQADEAGREEQNLD